MVALLGLLTGLAEPSPEADVEVNASDGPNLIHNGGFEIPADKGDAPKGWLTHGAKPEYVDAAVAGTEGEDTCTGTHAVRLSRPDNFYNRWAATNDARIKVAPSGKYLFAAWVKVSDFTPNREFVQLRFEQFDEAGVLLRPEKGPYLTGPRERPEPGKWMEIRHEFVVNADARMVRPLLVLANGGVEDSAAVATFDDAAMVKLGG
jgi:hypothetical protein